MKYNIIKATLISSPIIYLPVLELLSVVPTVFKFGPISSANVTTFSEVIGIDIILTLLIEATLFVEQTIESNASK